MWKLSKYIKADDDDENIGRDVEKFLQREEEERIRQLDPLERQKELYRNAEPAIKQHLENHFGEQIGLTMIDPLNYISEAEADPDSLNRAEKVYIFCRTTGSHITFDDPDAMGLRDIWGTLNEDDKNLCRQLCPDNVEMIEL